MRFLSFHCSYFSYEVKKKSRSKLIEELSDTNHNGTIDNCLVLFITIEKRDENNPDLVSGALNEIKNIIKQLKVKNIVLLSFAHLFGELSSPEFSLRKLKQLEEALNQNDFVTLRPPFGWFNEIELKAKGHPLSRISRIID
jgi:threonyl-tRNA synthetase